MIQPLTKDMRFWDKLAARYAAQPISDPASYQTKLEVTQSYLRPDMTVLELGCGTGQTALIHAPHVQRMVATDLSGGMINQARTRAAASNVDNVEFKQASLEDLEAPANSFDAVLALNLLHLVPDPNAALKKIQSLLKPGGYFIQSTMCLGDDLAFMALLAPIGRALNLIPHISVFTTTKLTGLVQETGIQIVHQWCPGKRKASFIVAHKAASQ